MLSTINSQNLRELTSLLGECEVDCDKDADCKRGLYCASDHSYDLMYAGLNKRKAYCGHKVGKWNEEVCYDPKKVPKKLKECEVDCDKDSDCAYGLVCAQTQKKFLQYYVDNYGYDIRKAYCDDVGKDNEEVCFDKLYFS